MKVRDVVLYNSNEVAEKLGLSVSTIRKYERDYDLDIMRNESNNRVYTEEDVEIFRRILEMKSEGANIHLIRKVLASEGIIDQVPEILEYPQTQSTSIEKFRKELIHEMAEIITQKETAMKAEFEEMLDAKLQDQERKIREQIAAENQKLISYIESQREEKKSVWSRIFGR